MRRVLLGAGAAGLLLGLTAAPAAAGGGQASISLEKTVSTADECGITDEITVVAGTDVYYCYTVTNTGSISFNTHDLTDDVLGDVLTAYDYVLAPGESVSLVIDPVTIDVETENCATWAAYNMTPGVTAVVPAAITPPVTASSCALVMVTPATSVTPTSGVAPSSAVAPTTAKAAAAKATPTYTG